LQERIFLAQFYANLSRLQPFVSFAKMHNLIEKTSMNSGEIHWVHILDPHQAIIKLDDMETWQTYI